MPKERGEEVLGQVSRKLGYLIMFSADKLALFFRDSLIRMSISGSGKL